MMRVKGMHKRIADEKSCSGNMMTVWLQLKAEQRCKPEREIHLFCQKIAVKSRRSNDLPIEVGQLACLASSEA